MNFNMQLSVFVNAISYLVEKNKTFWSVIDIEKPFGHNLQRVFEMDNHAYVTYQCWQILKSCRYLLLRADLHFLKLFRGIEKAENIKSCLVNQAAGLPDVKFF